MHRRRPGRVLGRRWRVIRRDEGGGVLTLSAEKGYSRETGNLIFHIALLAALVLIAIGRLFSYQYNFVRERRGRLLQRRGTRLVAPGRLAQDGTISPAPFCVQLDQFTATYLSTGEPIEVHCRRSAYNKTVSRRRLRAASDHGEPPAAHRGRSRLSDRARLRPERSPSGCLMARPARTSGVPPARTQPRCSPKARSRSAPEARAPTPDIGIEGFFAPTPADTGGGVDHLGIAGCEATRSSASSSIRARSMPPACRTVGVLARHDQTRPAPVRRIFRSVRPSGLPTALRSRSTAGFQWASMQVSHDPSQDYLLVAGVAMVLRADRLARHPASPTLAADHPGCVQRSVLALPWCPWAGSPAATRATSRASSLAAWSAGSRGSARPGA